MKQWTILWRASKTKITSWEPKKAGEKKTQQYVGTYLRSHRKRLTTHDHMLPLEKTLQRQEQSNGYFLCVFYGRDEKPSCYWSSAGNRSVSVMEWKSIQLPAGCTCSQRREWWNKGNPLAAAKKLLKMDVRFWGEITVNTRGSNDKREIKRSRQIKDWRNNFIWSRKYNDKSTYIQLVNGKIHFKYT